MDRIIQPFANPSAGPPARPGPFAGHPIGAAPSKSPGDYVRALRRRFWMALFVAVAVGVSGTIVVLRQPPVYQAVGQIEIQVPQFDEILSSLVPNGTVGQIGRDSAEKYIPNRLAQLRSKALAERVVSDPGIGPALGSTGDPALELLTGLQHRNLPNSNIYDIHVEGTNPERIAKLLNRLLDIFRDDAKREQDDRINESRRLADDSLRILGGELNTLDQTIVNLLHKSSIFTPDGGSLIARQYEMTMATLSQERARLLDVLLEVQIDGMFPHLRKGSPASPQETRLANLWAQKNLLTRKAIYLRRRIRKPDSDPAVINLTDQLRQVMDDIEEEMKSLPRGTLPNPSSVLAKSARERVDKLEHEAQALLLRMKESMPEVQTYLTLRKERDQKYANIAQMRQKLDDFSMLAKTQTPPVTVLAHATEPTVPVRPNRPMMIALVVLAGIAAGIGLVVLLEYIDQSVKVPEQLTMGLALPLFGVIPRMRRLARIHRGGHLWTPGAPSSVEADAYRNLRASLLGVSGPRGPIVTLLVTSAKAGEGKSTTSLNLAATCARAGERTLLMDADLRRPSLADVFSEGGPRKGLVDILRGDLPWQRTVVRTDIPNLDFLPTGDTLDVPIEILGTLELRQLMTALAGHYDRVILDGPAILGLADCRMLGRMVDAALMVVRSGANELVPLQRAKAMLEQSRVAIAGIVFNGLFEDFKNWSSYGTNPVYGDGGGPNETRALPDSRDLDAPTTDPAAMASAGSFGA